MILSKKQRLQTNNKGVESTGGHEVGGSSPLAPIFITLADIRVCIADATLPKERAIFDIDRFVSASISEASDNVCVNEYLPFFVFH